MKSLITANSHTKYYAEVQHGVFIAAVKKSGPGFAIHIENNYSPVERGTLLSSFASEFIIDSAAYELKIISNINTEFLHSFFKDREIVISKELKVAEPFEVIFDLESSHLKMSKKSESPNPVVTSKSFEKPSEVSSYSSLQQPIIAIGSSTGGVESLMQIFSRLPKQIPPIVASQHIPADFSRTLCERFNKLFSFEVKEAEDGDEVQANRILIAPGGKHLRIRKDVSGRYFAVVTEDAPINRHRPSVDALFKSVAECVGANAVGIILTGMGDDGAKGLLEMKEAGAYTIAQNKETCVVFGMPRVAIELGAVTKILPLTEIADEIMKYINKQKAA